MARAADPSDHLPRPGEPLGRPLLRVRAAYPVLLCMSILLLLTVLYLNSYYRLVPCCGNFVLTIVHTTATWPASCLAYPSHREPWQHLLPDCGRVMRHNHCRWLLFRPRLATAPALTPSNLHLPVVGACCWALVLLAVPCWPPTSPLAAPRLTGGCLLQAQVSAAVVTPQPLCC
jgi:hypothetical protein